MRATACSWLLLPALVCGADACQPTAHDRLLSKMGTRLLQRYLGPSATEPPLRLITVWKSVPRSLGQDSACVGRVCAQRIEPEDLPALLLEDGLRWADLPGRYRLRLDRAGPLIGAPAARERFGVTGRGVLLSLIDTGLDWTHPDFLDGEGRTRVEWLLDQGRPPVGRYPQLEALGQGAVFSADDLQAVLDGETGPAQQAGRDLIGHGTHVAGIAASSDPIYTGIAPEARLVVVKAITDSTGIDQDRALAALAFAREVSELAGRALVTNLSLGSQMGAHDGTEPMELAIAELVADPDPPCVVVVAAGNEGSRKVHARAALRPDGRPLRFELAVPRAQQPTMDRPARVVVDFWHDGDSRLRTRVISPAGNPSDSVDSAGPAWAVDSWTPDGRIGLATLPVPSPLNGLRRTTVTLSGEAGRPLSVGTWTVEMTGRARRIDGWIGDVDLAGTLEPLFVNHADPGELVGPPATARYAIAVGAMSSRADWTDGEGNQHRLKDAAVGQLAAFSVRGPTRDGRLKPELVAPGQVVASSLSGDLDPRSPLSMFYSGGSLRNVLPDGRHAVASGTSMAAPFVAGLCALVLQQQPWLTGQQLHARLQLATSSDANTTNALFSPDWGFGKLSAAAALAPIDEPAPGPADATASLCGSAKAWLPADPGQTLQVAAVPRSSAGRPLGAGLPVTIRAERGRFSAEVIDHGNGLYTRTLTGQGRRGDAISPICAFEGRPFVARPSVRLAGSHEEATGGGVVGGAGACAQTPAGRCPAMPQWVLLLLAIHRLRPRPIHRADSRWRSRA